MEISGKNPAVKQGNVAYGAIYAIIIGMDYERMTALQHLRKLPFPLRLVLSILFGTLIASLCLSLVTETINLDNDELGVLGYGFTTIIIFLVSLILALPILGIGFIVSAIFSKSIQKHMLPWCMAAPIFVWCLAAVFYTLLDAHNAPFATRLLHTLGSIDGLIFLFFSIPSAAIFYMSGTRRG